MQPRWSEQFFKLNRIAAVVAICLISIGMAKQPAWAKGGRSWSAKSDYSGTRNPSGQWSYGFSDSVGGNFKLARTHTFKEGIDSWIAVPNMACVEHDGSAFPIMIGSQTWQSGDLSLHCGHNGQVAILHFAVPSAGTYTVRASFFPGNPFAYARCSIVVDDYVVDSDLWNPNADPNDVTDYDFTAERQKFYVGETIEFEVSGQYVNGDVGLNVTITKLSN